MNDKPKSIEQWSDELVNLGEGGTFGWSINDFLRAFADEIVERCFEKLKNKWEPNVSYMPSAIRDALDAVKKEIAG